MLLLKGDPHVASGFLRSEILRSTNRSQKRTGLSRRFFPPYTDPRLGHCVFACRGLASYLDERGLPYDPFDDFFDVVKRLDGAE